MKNKKINILRIIIILILALGSLPMFKSGRVLAATSSSQPVNFGFTVSPELPSNQAASNLGYFDVLLNPGKSLTVNLVLRNATASTITFDCTIGSASTNSNGVVEYALNAAKADPTLAYNIIDYAHVQSKVVIPAKSMSVVPVTVKMPSASFDGVVAGGITLQQETTEKNQRPKVFTFKTNTVMWLVCWCNKIQILLHQS